MVWRDGGSHCPYETLVFMARGAVSGIGQGNRIVVWSVHATSACLVGWRTGVVAEGKQKNQTDWQFGSRTILIYRLVGFDVEVPAFLLPRKKRFRR